MLTSLTKGGGGVSQLLTITDKGGGGPDPPNMADIICEQSLRARKGKQYNTISCHDIWGAHWLASGTPEKRCKNATKRWNTFNCQQITYLVHPKTTKIIKKKKNNAKKLQLIGMRWSNCSQVFPAVCFKPKLVYLFTWTLWIKANLCPTFSLKNIYLWGLLQVQVNNICKSKDVYFQQYIYPLAKLYINIIFNTLKFYVL